VGHGDILRPFDGPDDGHADRSGQGRRGASILLPLGRVQQLRAIPIAIRLDAAVHVDAHDPDVIPRLAGGQSGGLGPFGSPARTTFDLAFVPEPSSPAPGGVAALAGLTAWLVQRA
jgi:hypothetical protein